MGSRTDSGEEPKIHLLKGNRCERMGQYMLMFEFDSVETRDRYFPASGQPSQELKRFEEPLRPLTTRWHAASARSKTDYVVMSNER